MGPWVLLLGLAAALPPSHPSPLDTDAVTVFRGDAAAAFGQTVAQFGTGDNGGILVGAPLHRGAGDKKGTIYRCHQRSGQCQEVPLMEPPYVVNASLGLTLANDDTKALACGPTVPQTCGANVHLKGFCVLLDLNLQQLQRIPDTQPECPKTFADIVLLIDGSGSINRRDFMAMKTFVTDVIRLFQGTDTQFALTQFSDIIVNHFDFATFRRSRDPILLLQQVQQLKGSTHTATAIWNVLTEMFTPLRGARDDARRILVVITDGRKFNDPLGYGEVTPLAERMGVTRYAIGVGRAFADPAALAELHTIASAPGAHHVFRVDTFAALQGIQRQLQEKIFAIEGTHPARSSSFQLEMAQEGFSALLTPEGPVLGAVGAYGWSGGVFVYGAGGEATFVNVSHGAGDMEDAYLGYAAESLSLGGHQALALGAPRYRHVGRLLLFHRRAPRAPWELLATAPGPQVGSYFGASLCALDPGGAGAAAVLLVGAPMFHGAGGGGRVATCALDLQGGQLRCPGALRGQPGHPWGRFGASLARLGDLDGDGWPEVAVGAPLEDEERGALYVFRGRRGGLEERYSQRISGAHFSSRPRHLGQALSGGRDLTGDRLPEVAVGAQGQVLLLRSRPLLRLRATVAFQPNQVPAAAAECHQEEAPVGEVAKATICFLITKETQDNYGGQLSITLRYQAALDPGRTVVRAIFAGGSAVHAGTLRVGVGQRCETLAISLPGCPRDTLTPLVLRVTSEATGDPLAGGGGLRAALSRDSELVAVGTLPFEKNCGADNICVDDLRVALNFSGLETLVVGDTEVLDVTVTLRNRGEASYGTVVTLRHPQALSYRKVTVLQSSRRSMSLQCNSEPAVGTLCGVTPPIFLPGAEVVFTVSLTVPPGAELGGTLEVVAEASSDSGAPGGRGERAEVKVKYGVVVVLSSPPGSTQYTNVSTRGGVPASAPVTHRYEVRVLGRRGLPLTVTFLVPAALGGAPLWERLEVTPDQEGVRCRAVAEHPEGPDAPQRRREGPLLDCAAAACRELQCGVPALPPPRAVGFSLGGRLALGWLSASPQPRVLVQSSARVRYDRGVFSNGGVGEGAQVQTELERLEPPQPLPLLLGGTAGGLALLALLTLALYKMGFFKRRFKELLEEDTGSAPPPAGEPQS